MKTTPILYSPPMACASIEGRKGQTRRALYPQPDWLSEVKHTLFDNFIWPIGGLGQQCGYPIGKFPYGKPGDLLWAREEHYRFGHWEPVPGVLTKRGRQKWAFIPDSDEVLFDAPAAFRGGRHHNDPYTPAWHKRLARFMFREHSRFTQRITGIRVERLQDISEMDAYAEGIDTEGDAYLAAEHAKLGGVPCRAASIHAYADLWDSINGPASWDANPWVWVIETETHLCNVDEFLRRAGA